MHRARYVGKGRAGLEQGRRRLQVHGRRPSAPTDQAQQVAGSSDDDDELGPAAAAADEAQSGAEDDSLKGSTRGRLGRRRPRAQPGRRDVFESEDSADSLAGPDDGGGSRSGIRERSASELGRGRHFISPPPTAAPPPRALLATGVSRSETALAGGHNRRRRAYKPISSRSTSVQLNRTLSSSSLFALYASKYPPDKFELVLRAFRLWYREQLTYHHLSGRMEFNKFLFDRWYERKGRPVGLRALDHYDKLVIWIADERDEVQKRTFIKWINKYLDRRGKEMKDLIEDLRDGQNLITLLEMLSGQTLPRERGRMRVHQLQNIQIALNYIRLRKVKLVNIRPEDIADGNHKLILGLIWTIILHFQIRQDPPQHRTTRMYSYEKNSRVYLKNEDGHSSRSPLQESEQKNKMNCNGQQAQPIKTKSLKESQQRARSSELGNLTAPGETRTKTQMARAIQETEELYKTADSKAGLQTVKQIHVRKKTTTITRGENEKLETDGAQNEFQLRLDDMKRELDELECRIDNMAPVAEDLATLHQQLTEINEFKRTLTTTRKKLNELVKCGEDLIKDDLIADPAGLRANLKGLKDQLARIEDKADRRHKAIQDGLARAEAQRAADQKFRLRLEEMKRKLDEMERKLDNMAPVAKDAPALQRQLEEMDEFDRNLGVIRRDLNDLIKASEDFIREGLIGDPAGLRAGLKGLKEQLRRIEDKADKRRRDIQEALNRLDAQRAAEQKFRLRLDEMKRELDEMERKLDNMAPVAKDLPTLQKQLDEINDFNQRLNGTRRNLNELIMTGEELISEGLIADPPALRASLNDLKDQLRRIEDKAGRRLKAIQDALNRLEAQRSAQQKFQMRLDAMKRELEELERRLDNMAPVAKDLPTLQKQLDEMNDFNRNLNNTKRNLNELIKAGEDLIREDLISDPAALRASLKDLKEHLARIEDKFNRRMKAIQDAMKRAEGQRAAEQKFRLRLDEMKRELDELERKLDNMAPVARDLGTLQKQLAEIHDFMQKLNGTGKKLAELLKAGDELIREDLIADPIKLRADLKELKDQFARIEEKAAKRLRDIQDAMSRVAASDAIQALADWLERARKVLMDEENVHGDLDTVNTLIEQHKSFQGEVAAHQPTINEIKRMEQELSNTSPANGAIVRDELTSLINKWKEVEKLTREKSEKLEEALRAAEQMHVGVADLLEWLADSEMKLRFAGSLPEDEQATRAELAEHEKFMKKLASQCQSKDQILKLAKDILNKCHPDAEPVIKLNTNIIQSRWEDIEAWAKQRGQRLQDHLKNLLDILGLVEELINWLGRHENRLLAEEAEPLPDNAHQLESLIDQHSGFMDELRKRELDVDRVIKIFAAKSSTSTNKMILTTSSAKPAASSGSGRASAGSSGRLSAGGARSTTPTRTSYATYRDEYPEVRQPRAKIMLEKWRKVWQLCVDKMQRLKDRVEHLKEVERLENFDFDQWRRRFISWLNTKKYRASDFYRSIDDDNDGRIPFDAFVAGVLRSKFESSRLEMERVASIMDKNADGSIESKEYLDSLRPDQPVTDDELIQDEVQRQVARCTCSQRFKVYHVGEGRYRFGESQKLRLVRILRSTVMVRIGGGWEALDSFLQKNDPCRARGRTNVELREQFILPEGSSQAMAAFKSRMSKDPGSMPALGPITKIREKTDRSMPMSGSRHASPSDYYSETESTKTRSRLGRPAYD